MVLCVQNLQWGLSHSSQRDLGVSLPSPAQKSPTPSQPNIPVFYNLFVSEEGDASRVRNIVEEQFSYLQPYHHPIYLNSIGFPLQIPNTTLLGHHDSASELVSLQDAWEYCKFFPQGKIVYLHSKGSYTKTQDNELLRRFNTKGALSDACATMPDTCNVCSSRFSPVPHPHNSGNMWLARCDYIRKLIEPKYFERRMEDMKPRGDLACVGRNRYALEHWVHSHPSVRPCDVYESRNFTWNYENIPEVDQFNVNVGAKSAPRFALKVYDKALCKRRGEGKLKDRLKEYKFLYQELPTSDWWGWDLWKANYSDYQERENNVTNTFGENNNTHQQLAFQ